MIAKTPYQHPKSELFLDPPSRVYSAATWSMGKVAAGLQHLRGNCCTEGFGILMYHRVAENPQGVAAPTLNVTPGQFRNQLAGLLARGFQSWPLSKLVSAHLESRPVPTNVFAVTFDDGYENNYVHALPILRELNVAATVFLTTKYLDSNRPFPFDAWSGAGLESTDPSAWRPLSTEQCREMLASGVIELGAHTHTHRRWLGRESEFVRDMRPCLEYLANRLGVACPTFAFPFGEFNTRLINAAKQLEISCAVTVRQRRVHANDDAFQWGRFHVGQSDTPAMLAAKLSGWHSILLSAAKKVIRPLPAMVKLAGIPASRELHERTYRGAAFTGKAPSQP
jgi:peptidoglycan/xylan/chitin deacetylase (PgdA/CDA1 family)